jgi:hypothetical protein
MNIQSLERVTLSLLVLAVTACSDSSGSPADATPGTGGAPSAGGAPGAGGSETTNPGAGGSTPGPTGGGGMPASSGTGGAAPAGNAVPLTVDPTGWVDKGGNTVGIQGPWYSYDDCTDSPGACTMNHTPGTGAFDNTDGKMCTKGTTYAVKAEADFSKEWGAGIALDLNNSGGTDAMKLPFDATANHVIGFSMNITGTAPGLRVNITSQAAGDDSHYKNGKVGANSVLLSEVKQGTWVKMPAPLDQTKILAVQFQIPSVMGKAVDFDFCVENLSAITN